MHPVLNVIKLIGTRGLAFRGSDNTIVSDHNGNYLGILQLIVQYDPLLKKHIERFANKGKGTVSYLSKDICGKFVIIIYDYLINEVAGEIQKSKVYSGSVDSTPDKAHIGQFTFTIRYILSNSVPVEKMIKFIEIKNHTLSNTRWSDRSVACQALRFSYFSFAKSLLDVINDLNELLSTRAEAEGIYAKFFQLETGIHSLLWDDIL